MILGGTWLELERVITLYRAGDVAAATHHYIGNVFWTLAAFATEDELDQVAEHIDKQLGPLRYRDLEAHTIRHLHARARSDSERERIERIAAEANVVLPKKAKA